jgi:MipA family protein
MPNLRSQLAMCLLALLGAAPVAAEQLPLWELGLGAGTLRLPHYRGSDQYHHWLLPIPYIVYRGDILRSDRQGTRAVLLDTERVDIDISIDGSPPTRSADNRTRAGMPDLAATLQIGPKLNLVLGRGEDWKFDLRLPLRTVVAAESRPRTVGWTFSPILNLDLRWQGWNLGFSGGPQAASRSHNAYFYDVAPAYATAARPVYAAAGGRSGWGMTASASRHAGPWWLAAYVHHESLTGAGFRTSPLVKQNSNLSFGLALSRVLMVSDERVAERP